jgi:hypothetical protein
MLFWSEVGMSKVAKVWDQKQSKYGAYITHTQGFNIRSSSKTVKKKHNS